MKREDPGAVPGASTITRWHLSYEGGELGSTARREIRRDPFGEPVMLARTLNANDNSLVTAQDRLAA